VVLQLTPFEVYLTAHLEEGTGEGLVGTHLQVGRQLAAGEASQLTHVRAHHWKVLAGLKVGGKTVQREEVVLTWNHNLWKIVCTRRH